MRGVHDPGSTNARRPLLRRSRPSRSRQRRRFKLPAARLRRQGEQVVHSLKLLEHRLHPRPRPLRGQAPWHVAPCSMYPRGVNLDLTLVRMVLVSSRLTQSGDFHQPRTKRNMRRMTAQSPQRPRERSRSQRECRREEAANHECG